MRIVGAVGQIGSGKDTVIRYISKRFSTPILSIGDIAREIARNKSLPATRENLQKITQKCLEEFGRTYFIEETIKKIKNGNEKRILITGIRAPTDVEALRSCFQHDFILICVMADRKRRFLRLVKRAESRDPTGWREFLRQDKAEEQIFHLSRTCKLADYRINNNGSPEDLFKRVDEIIQKRLADW